MAAFTDQDDSTPTSLPASKYLSKNIWRYLFEFFMLFFAVLCGFLVENFREQQLENDSAEVLAKNLYKELIADSIAIQDQIAMRKIKEEECEYFVAYVKDSSLTKLSDRFYRSFSWSLIQTQRILFEPNDGILNQLRNSGELRYFKSPELQAAVGQISVRIANIRARHDREYSYVEGFLRPFSIKFYDFNWYQELTRHGSMELNEALISKAPVSTPGKIPDVGKFDRHEAESTVSYYLLMLRGTRKLQYTQYALANHQLLEILRQEYHLQ